jgi:RND family efflux transporter MFP subunit
MKKITIILLSLTALFACKKEEKKPELTSIAGIKLEKTKQEKAKDSISKIIIDLETKLAKLDTTKVLQPVTPYKITPSQFEHYISIQGNTKTDKNILVRPLANGIITGVYVKEGQRVVNGQKMFQLDNSILVNSINEIKNQLTLAQTAYERQKRLWDQKIGSEMQYLQAKTNKEALENKIRTLNSQLKNYRVTAPFSGIVDDLIATKGDLASPQTPLAQIVNLRDMYIESDVAENYLTSIKKGSKVVVSLNAIGKEIITKITQVGNTISPDNRTFKVRINIPNKKGEIKPNLLADIKIKDFDVKEAIVIPSRLVQIDENGNNFVFTITEKDNKKIVAKNLINVASNYENKSFITSGLSKEDVLIDEGSRSVSSEQEVSLILLEEKKVEQQNDKQ